MKIKSPKGKQEAQQDTDLGAPSQPLALSVLRQAINAVPAVEYALGIAGIISVLAIVNLLNLDFRIAIVGAVVMLVLMTALLIFARLATMKTNAFRAPAVILMWFSLALTILSATLLFISLFFRWPVNLRDWSEPRGSVGAGSTARGDLPGALSSKQIAPSLNNTGSSIGETDYHRLASPALNGQFVGKPVTFRAMFLSEWTQADVYGTFGISTKNVVFLNHRAIDYAAVNSPFGVSDNEIPPFPLSMSADQAGLIYALHRGDPILVTGHVEQTLPSKRSGVALPIPDFAKIYVRANTVKKLTAESN